MPHTSRKFPWPALLLALATFIAPALAQVEPAAADPAGEDAGTYIRVRDSEDGEHAYLQIAIRSFTKQGAPTIHLVGVAHIADKVYYADLQNFLDAQDLVLFEGVKPGGAPKDLANADDAAKVKVTKSRQRLLAVIVARHQAKTGKLPETLNDALQGLHGPMSRLGQSGLLDAWGHEQQYIVNAPEEGKAKATFDIVSLGSDNAEGGEGGAADLRFSDQKPLSKQEREGGEGIQMQLASALGLEFQLTAIDYNREKWRNSDMTVDELEDRLREAGQSASALFGMLDGSSMMSKLLSLGLGLVSKSPEMSFYFKVTLVETLAHADEMMGARAEMLGKGMAEFMRVIVLDRNEVVFRDLEAALKENPRLASVALFYGAGHLPDMEQRLSHKGYTLSDVQWKNAIDIDAAQVQGGKAVMKQVRAQIAAAMKAQQKKAARKEDDAQDPERNRGKGAD
jgi:hypothetical protein